MKKFLFPLGLAVVIASTGCSDDFAVSAPYKKVTAVYGMLDPQDTAHYIRVQKAFLDESKSAIDMSKVSDSSFYKDSEIEVKMQEINPNSGKVINGNIPMSRVDMNLEGYAKKAAINQQSFFTTPNYAYKTKQILNPGSSYNIVITTKATGAVIETKQNITLVNSKTDNVQGGFYVSEFQNANAYLDFTRTTNENKYILRGKIPNNAVMFEGILRFRYVEKNTATGAEVDKFVDYNFDSYTNEGTVQIFTLEVQVIDIYKFLASEIGPAPTDIERYMDSCDIFVWAANSDLYNYNQVNQAQTGGITSDQIKPNYTNLKGDNVLGIIASRTFTAGYNIPLGREASTGGSGNFPANYTLDSLKENAITRNLNIKGRSSH